MKKVIALLLVLFLCLGIADAQSSRPISRHQKHNLHLFQRKHYKHGAFALRKWCKFSKQGWLNDNTVARSTRRAIKYNHLVQN